MTVYFEIISTIAIMFGLATAYLFDVGIGMGQTTASAGAAKGAADAAQKAADPHTTFSQFFLNMFADNFMGAFAKGELLQVLVIAVIFGAALLTLKPAKRAPIRTFGAVAYAVDGTKAAIEMAAVANGTGLHCPDDGLAFPPAGLHDLARVFRPKSDGGRMARSGLVDIAASQEPDGREVFNNIRYGVFVTFKAHDEYARSCFKQYGLLTDPSGWYASMWRRFHIIGLETSISVLSAVLRNEPTGSSKEFRGDAVATAKKDMQPGEMLDGEGGYAVWANAIPATRSLDLKALPIGLAHNVKLKRAVKKDQIVSFDDVEIVKDLDVVNLRREMEDRFRPSKVAAE